MNPLARLMERIRKPDSADLADAAAPAARTTAPETARPARSRKPLADNHVRANQEALAMYPYPPQSPSYPQASYPYAPTPQPQFQQPQPAAYPPQYAQLPQYPAHFAPQHLAYPYPPQMAQPAFHAWQPQPVAVDAYGRPQQFMPPYPGYPMQAPQAAAAGLSAGYPAEATQPRRRRDRQPRPTCRSRVKCRRSRRCVKACANSVTRSAISPKAARAGPFDGRILRGCEFTAPDGAVTGLRRRIFVKMPPEA